VELFLAGQGFPLPSFASGYSWSFPELLGLLFFILTRYHQKTEEIHKMARPQKKIKIDQLISVLRECFQKVNDPRTGHKIIPLNDFLMSSYAIFSLKYPSLLRFDQHSKEDIGHNIKALFDITNLPSDTHLRDIMDEVNPKHLRRIFTSLFAELQKTKVLSNYEFIEINGVKHYLISLDGTGYFSSHKISCEQCIRYHDKEDSTKELRFGHNVLAASMVHPEQREVFSFCPEPIVIQDGVDKNDCELNAFKRFVADFRREHPKLTTVFVMDALYARTPVIELLRTHRIPYIINVKENMGLLMSQFKEEKSKGQTGSHIVVEYHGQKIVKKLETVYHFSNELRLFQLKDGPKSNFIECQETLTWTDKDGKEHRQKKTYTWITDIWVTKENVKKLSQGGRARWKIENETFNTLKNQGYYLEHNYGHGDKNLSVNMVSMMFTAFLVDQIQQACCQTFKKAFAVMGERPSYLWEKILSIFKMCLIDSWDQVFTVISEKRLATFSTS
jgi:hypothetical protein